MLSKLPTGSRPAGAKPFSHENAHFTSLRWLPDAGWRADRERDAVQVANPQEPIWTRV